MKLILSRNFVVVERSPAEVVGYFVSHYSAVGGILFHATPRVAIGFRGESVFCDTLREITPRVTLR